MSDDQIEALFATHVPPVQIAARALRRLIRSTFPEAEERLYPGWHAVGYVHPEAGLFCGIFPRDAVVKLSLEFGAFLPDPAGLLTGKQKQIRYVLIEDESDIAIPEVTALLRAAVSFQSTRKRSQ